MHIVLINCLNIAEVQRVSGNMTFEFFILGDFTMEACFDKEV